MNTLKQGRFHIMTRSPIVLCERVKIARLCKFNAYYGFLLKDWFSGDSGYYEEPQCVV